MRYLAIALLTPWLLILSWAYWSWPRRPRSRGRRLFDLLALLLALGVAALSALAGFDQVQLPTADVLGQPSGGIWQQVLPALYAYGAFTLVLLVALLLRRAIWRRRL